MTVNTGLRRAAPLKILLPLSSLAPIRTGASTFGPIENGFWTHFIDTVNIKCKIASVKCPGQVDPFVLGHHRESDRSGGLIRNAHSICISSIGVGAPQFNLQHHRGRAPPVRLGEKVLKISRSIPERPKGKGELPRPVRGIEDSAVDSRTVIGAEHQRRTGAPAFWAGPPFRGPKQRAMVTIAGTVAGGGAGTVIEPPVSHKLSA